jgi:hypothetical protein
MKTPITRRLSAATLALATSCAQAHDGHGLLGSHWHATDSLGFVGLAIALAVAVWLSRGGK